MQLSVDEESGREELAVVVLSLGLCARTMDDDGGWWCKV